MKQGPYWTDPANQVVWDCVERYHVGIGGWGENMRVRVEDRKEAWELVPERTCHIIKPTNLLLDREVMCSECGRLWLEKGKDSYCTGCGAKVVEA